MWLETLTIQTHQSSKTKLEMLYKDIVDDVEFTATEVKIFYHQNAVLHVTWHLIHKHVSDEDCSIQALRLLELLRPFGWVHHRTWLPMFY